MNSNMSRVAVRACAIFGVSAGVALLVVAPMGTNMALAQTAPATPASDQLGLEEIIVTARKTTESFMKVPVTEGAVGAADLERYQINDVVGIVTQIPAIRFDQTYGGGGGTLTIRGIGSSTSDSGVDQTVATVFDGVQTSKGLFTKIGFLDLEQVEVLKGPQALFFGKNSPGGVLSLQSAGPTDTYQAYASAGYGAGIGQTLEKAAVSGPLGGDFRARLAVSYDDTTGWMHDVVQNTANPFFGAPGAAPTLGGPPWNSNWDRQWLGRLTLDYKPNSDFTATVRLSGSRDRNAGISSQGELTSCGGPAKPDFIGVPDPYNDCNLNYNTSVGAIPVQVRGQDVTFPNSPVQLGTLDSYMGGLTLDYKHGPIDITSVTGYMHYYDLEDHESATSFGYGINGVDGKWYQFSQELRAVTNFDGPLNFAGGAYYDSTRDTEHGPNLIIPLPADPRTPTAANPFYGSYFTYVYDGIATSENYSVFTQARWKIINQLELDAGVRYSHDHQTGNVANSFVNTNSIGIVPLEAGGEHVAGSKNYVNFSPEYTLTWTATPDTIVYATYRTGYKPGESGNPYIVSAGLTPETLFYQTETVKGGELGFKSSLLDNKLRVTGAAFVYLYHDLQVSNFNSTDFVLTPLAGNMKTDGFEFDVTYRVIPPLRLTASAAYTHAFWTSFPGVACYSVGNLGTEPRPDVAPNCDLSGTPATNPNYATENLTGLPKFRAPQWTGNIGLVYDFPAFRDIKTEFNTNLYFTSSYNSQENDSPFAQQTGYRILDAGFRFSSFDDHLQFEVIGKNVTDTKYVGATYDQANANYSATVFGIDGPPRSVLFQVTYRY